MKFSAATSSWCMYVYVGWRVASRGGLFLFKCLKPAIKYHAGIPVVTHTWFENVSCTCDDSYIGTLPYLPHDNTVLSFPSAFCCPQRTALGSLATDASSSLTGNFWSATSFPWFPFFLLKQLFVQHGFRVFSDFHCPGLCEFFLGEFFSYI